MCSVSSLSDDVVAGSGVTALRGASTTGAAGATTGAGGATAGAGAHTCYSTRGLGDIGTEIGAFEGAVSGDPAPTESRSFKIGTAEGRDGLGRYYNYLSADELGRLWRDNGRWTGIELESRLGGAYDGRPTEWTVVTATAA